MAVALRAARCIAYMWQTVPQAIDEGVNDDVAPKADLCEHALMFHMRVRARSYCCARMGVRVCVCTCVTRATVHGCACETPCFPEPVSVPVSARTVPVQMLHIPAQMWTSSRIAESSGGNASSGATRTSGSTICSRVSTETFGASVEPWGVRAWRPARGRI